VERRGEERRGEEERSFSPFLFLRICIYFKNLYFLSLILPETQKPEHSTLMQQQKNSPE